MPQLIFAKLHRLRFREYVHFRENCHSMSIFAKITSLFMFSRKFSQKCNFCERNKFASCFSHLLLSYSYFRGTVVKANIFANLYLHKSWRKTNTFAKISKSLMSTRYFHKNSFKCFQMPCLALLTVGITYRPLAEQKRLNIFLILRALKGPKKSKAHGDILL
jgi:hypothetical protein